MEIINNAGTTLKKYFDLRFFARFIGLLLLFYFLNLFFVKVANPRSDYYNEFLSKNFHYGSWMRTSILETSNMMTKTMGMDTYLQDSKTIRVRDGRALLMARQCLGLEIIGFWLAFILAHSIGWKRKFVWSFVGIASIWMINCLRVAVLLYAKQNKWQIVNNIDPHDMFNYVAYALVIALIYFFYRKGSEESLATVTAKT